MCVTSSKRGWEFGGVRGCMDVATGYQDFAKSLTGGDENAAGRWDSIPYVDVMS